MTTALHSIVLAALVGCAGTQPEFDHDGEGDGDKADDLGDHADGLLVVTASTVAALAGDVSSVRPSIDRLFPDDPLDPAVYLRPMSCLGFYGPVGPWGPLGLLGPVGQGSWNPSVYVSGAASLPWRAWSDELPAVDGPLGASGPLGADGPLGQAYWDDLPAIGDFGPQLQAGGLFSVLGPVGPLGPLGPLGSLGPIGAHGLVADRDGNYRDGDAIVRAIEVPWDDEEVRTYELFEDYPSAVAREMEDNDTSFMAQGSLRVRGVDEYRFSSADDQFVTVAVVPESALLFLPQAMTVLFAAAAAEFETPALAPAWRHLTDDLDLAITDDDGAVIASSETADRIDWIQLRVPAGTRLTARVTMRSSWSIESLVFSLLSGSYRLVVVGSTRHIRDTAVSGDHQRRIERR